MKESDRFRDGALYGYAVPQDEVSLWIEMLRNVQWETGFAENSTRVFQLLIMRRELVNVR